MLLTPLVPLPACQPENSCLSNPYKKKINSETLNRRLLAVFPFQLVFQLPVEITCSCPVCVPENRGCDVVTRTTGYTGDEVILFRLSRFQPA